MSRYLYLEAMIDTSTVVMFIRTYVDTSRRPRSPTNSGGSV